MSYGKMNSSGRKRRANKTIRVSCLFLVLLFFVCFGRGDVPAGKAAAEKEPAEGLAQTADVSTIEAVVSSVYKSITFCEGGKPDMERFRSLFSPGAQFIRISREGVAEMDCDGFISGFSERIRTGVLKSFYEAEIARKTQAYGDIAQVFTSYNKGVNTDNPDSYTRGINCLQMFYEKERWYISSLLWQDESKENPIPREYLR